MRDRSGRFNIKADKKGGGTGGWYIPPTPQVRHDDVAVATAAVASGHAHATSCTGRYLLLIDINRQLFDQQQQAAAAATTATATAAAGSLVSDTGSNENHEPKPDCWIKKVHTTEIIQ